MKTSPLRLLGQAAFVDIAVAGADSPRHDTATVVEQPDGRLLVAWHAFRNTPLGGSDFGASDIAARTSFDGGRTWSPPRIVIRCAEGDLNIQAPALCLLPGGDLLLSALRAHARDSSSMCLFRSRDGGVTWSEAGCIWSHSAGQWLQGGAAGLLRLRRGRLLLPFHGGSGGQHTQHNTAGCFVSDDDGASWRRTPAVIDLPMRGAMEASVAELADGRLLTSLRSQLGTVFLCESRDAGESWSLPWSSGLTAPESCTCLRRIGASDSLLLVWNGCAFYEPTHHHFGPRHPLSLALSRDAGRSWVRLGDLENDASCAFSNINCTFLANGDAVITYWVASPPFGRNSDMKHSDIRAALVPAAYWAGVA